VIPDLPKATYQVFVRGYGLTDSDRVQAAPGKILNLTAKIAPSPKDAAQYYPANYWFAMLNIPAKSEFPLQLDQDHEGRLQAREVPRRPEQAGGRAAGSIRDGGGGWSQVAPLKNLQEEGRKRIS
jgi:hypothetical protein